MRSPWVFVGPRGGRLDPHNFCEDYFIPALERAGICKPRPKPLRRDRKHSAAAARPTKDPKAPRERREFTWHDLRHTMASRLVMAGRELYDVQRLLGHKDYKMTLRYAHLSPRHLRDAIRSISVAPAPQSENKPEKRQTAG